jgi:hypothetical protein
MISQIRLIRVSPSFWWPAKPRRPPPQLRASEEISEIRLHPRDRTTDSRGQPERLLEWEAGEADSASMPHPARSPTHSDLTNGASSHSC